MLNFMIYDEGPFLKKCENSNNRLNKIKTIEDLNEFKEEYFKDMMELFEKAGITFTCLSDIESCGENDYYYLGDKVKRIDYNNEFWDLAEELKEIYDKRDEFLVEIYVN